MDKKSKIRTVSTVSFYLCEKGKRILTNISLYANTHIQTYIPYWYLHRTILKGLKTKTGSFHGKELVSQGLGEKGN